MPEPYSDYSSSAYENDHIVKATPGRLFSFIGYSSKSSAQWIQVHDSATVPANGAVPKFSIRVTDDSNFEFSCEWLERPIFFAHGIYICNSTTGPTKTLGSDDCLFYVTYA